MKRVISLPFFIFGGALYNNDSILDKLIGQAISIAKERDIDYLLLKQRKAIPDSIVNKQGLRKVIEEYTFYLYLTNNVEEVWKKLPKGSVRWGIKKAEKEGVRVIEGKSLSDLKEFYKLFLITRRNRGIPAYPFRFYKELWERFMSKKWIRLLSAEYKGEIIASIITNNFNKEISYAHGGSKMGKEIFNLQPYHPLLWEAIKHGCENGFRIFDLHGAPKGLKGIYEFKEKWSDETVPIYHYYFLNKKNEIPDLDPGSERYRLARNVWSKLPLKFTERLSSFVLPFFVR